ncbi:MAG: hypothetical protein PHG79_01625 [Methanosarcina sp.]|jgi:hypothetical protein|nr:hypothetical protein [Methanosarcina sp.]MDD4523106.1 hypothetical protein [Methanosarcina sp.]HHV25033.1 hypothetical protein [Methanosarcina sp.]
MRNINILYYGKVKKVDVYESMFEYVKSSGITDCEKDYTEGQPDYFVEEWQAALDSEMYFEYDLMKDAGEIEVDGQTYTRIGRRVTELSYVPTDSLPEILYVIYHSDHNMRKCNFTNEIFQTKEEAEKRANELRGKCNLS